MSRRQDIQTAQGVALACSPFGALQVVRTSAPSGGEVGFAPGCEWFVPSAATGVGSMYTNIGGNGYGTNATATWIESDPSSGGKFQFGLALTSTGYMAGSGNIYRFQSGTGATPATTGSDIVVDTFTLPANALDAAGRILTITATGNLAANGNTKTAKIIFNATTAVVGSAVTGGTTLATTGASTGNNVGWMLQGQITKYGVKNANTQVAQELSTVVGTSHGGMGTASGITATENAAIIIAITINCATTATDGSLWTWEVNAQN